MFWPRTALSPAADVLFDFSIDGKTTRLPLIFVDNTAVQEEENLRILSDYYNGMLTPDYHPTTKAPLDLPFNTLRHKRTARFGGQAMRYAEEIKPGDCAIETETWTISAQGRKSINAGDKVYH